MKDLILAKAPVWLQNSAISVYNRYQWQQRRKGDYKNWRAFCEKAALWSEDEWRHRQTEELEKFLDHAVRHSKHYAGINPKAGLQAFPMLEKQTLITALDQVKTIDESEGVVSYTGGTTGASMKVIYTTSDYQKRFATLDWFRSLSGWDLGRPTAWFSGKTIVRDIDIQNGICHRDDWLTKTRFFSTFHISESNFDLYWRALIDFAPEYIVGFPSSLSEILSIARNRNLKYPHKVIAVFPTAETVLDYHRELFTEVLGAVTRDQYASSEGAPFIIECSSGRLHTLPYTGVFEVVDEAGAPAREGELLVTAFHTHGTPLIRYRVGDRISLAPEGERCSCGCTFPLVERIEGRTSDFVWSPEYGRVNLGNLSNSTKGVAGIVAFRITQNDPDAILIEIQASDAFGGEAERKFETALRKRVGRHMHIKMTRVQEIPRKKSGKFKIVENYLNPEHIKEKINEDSIDKK